MTSSTTAHLAAKYIIHRHDHTGRRGDVATPSGGRLIKVPEVWNPQLFVAGSFSSKESGAMLVASLEVEPPVPGCIGTTDVS